MISGKIIGAEEFIEAAKLLAMTSKDRERYFGKMGRQSVKLARLRIQDEKDLDGRAWAPRKRRKKQGSQKLLKNIALKRVLGVWQDENEVTITYFNDVSGKIAYKHQYGVTTSYTRKDGDGMTDPDRKEKASEVAKIFLTGRKKSSTESRIQDACTQKQAQKLVRLGFRQRMRNGKWQPRSIRWIQSHVTQAQAGIIIMSMISKGSDTAKASWPIPLPPRPFLGLNQQERKDMGLKILTDMKDEVLQAIK